MPVKQKSSLVLVLIISLMCIDSVNTLSLCGFSVPPAHFPFLQPHDTESDATLGEVTGCHCLSLLIFTSPYILSINFKLLPQVTNTLRVINGLDPVGTRLRKWKMICWHGHYPCIVTLIFYPRGVIAKLHSVSIMLVNPGGLDQSVFTLIDNWCM